MCPPIREELDPAVIEAARADGLPLGGDKPALFSFPTKTAGEWQLHHAAQFAVVRWTNIHDPALLVAFGDVISSPVAPIFGDGIVDIDLGSCAASRGVSPTRAIGPKPGRDNSRRRISPSCGRRSTLPERRNSSRRPDDGGQ